MEMILVLIPVSVVVIAVAIAAFMWAVDSGQYENVGRDGDATLFEDGSDPVRNTETPSS